MPHRDRQPYPRRTRVNLSRQSSHLGAEHGTQTGTTIIKPTPVAPQAKNRQPQNAPRTAPKPGAMKLCACRMLKDGRHLKRQGRTGFHE